MTRWISDAALGHLRALSDVPDTSGTRYSIVAKLGQGGMGAVYRALDRDLGRHVALKVLHPEHGDAGTAARLRREARILAGLEHPGIVPVHEIGVLVDGRVYYVMKHVQGVRLDEFVRAEADLHRRLDIFLRICEAVAFAHAQGVVHRDLKPENVMTGAFGEVLVLDWGVAKLLAGPDPPAAPAASPVTELDPGLEPAADAPAFLTQHGDILGTPSYMAPEQKRGDSVDARADVYALGGLLHFLLCGEPSPAPGRASPSAVAQSRPLAAICERATAAPASARYPGVEALAADVRRFTQGQRVQAYREPPLESIRRLVVRFRTPILLVLAYLAVRALLLVWFRR